MLFNCFYITAFELGRWINNAIPHSWNNMAYFQSRKLLFYGGDPSIDIDSLEISSAMV